MWPVILTIILFVIGLVILALASDYLVTGLVKFANIVKIPEFIIGTIILGIGTSLPEFVNNIMANLQGVPLLGVGNVIGASVTNVSLTMGVMLFIGKPVKIESDAEWKTIFYSFVPIVLLLIFGLDGLLAKWEGGILLGAFVLYQFLLFKCKIKRHTAHVALRRLILPYIFVPLSIFSIIIGAFLAVDTASVMALLAGVPAAVIGLTIVAMGTTLPELSSSITAARQGKHHLAFGNLYGSTLINLLMILGIVASVFSVPFNFGLFFVPLMLLGVSTAVFMIYVKVRKQTDRILASVLLGTYVVYLIVNLLTVI